MGSAFRTKCSALIGALAFALALAALVVFSMRGSDRAREKALPSHAQGSPPPWIVTVKNSGQVEALGVMIGRDSVRDVQAHVRAEPEIKLFIESGSQSAPMALEADFGRINFAGITGDLIATIEATDERMAELASTGRVDVSAPSRAIKLSPRGYRAAMEMPIRALTLIPTFNLTEQILTARFGEPDRVIDFGDGVQQWFYSDRAVYINLSEKGKEAIMYTTPELFDRLTRIERSE